MVTYPSAVGRIGSDGGINPARATVGIGRTRYGTSTGGSGGGGGTMPGGDVTHGDQLTLAHVGPWAVQGVAQGAETLRTVSGASLSERVSNWHPRPSWIPGTTYNPNDTSNTNYGGIVGVGGVTIDGRTYAAGTYIVQNTNFSGNTTIIIEGVGGTSGPFVGIVFRACRMRNYYAAPGFYSQNSQSTGGIVAFHYCDAGGVDLVTPCESAFESSLHLGASDRQHILRCYISKVTSGAFGRNHGDSFVENYLREVTDFGNPAYHLNGFANSGSETATLWLRNNMVLVKQSGSTQITDVIQFAADNGSYPGGGTNVDGSSGYWIKDNYLGGANYTLQLGQDTGRSTTMSNCTVSGNKFTTSLYANSGESGLGYKGPSGAYAWGSSGNTWTGNTWADGVNAGVTITSAAVTAG